MSRLLFHRKRKHAIVLAIFTSETGLHRLYLGDLPGALGRLLLHFTRLPSGLIEALRLICMSDREFDRRYNPHISAPPTVPRPSGRSPSAVEVLGVLLVLVLVFDVVYLLANR